MKPHLLLAETKTPDGGRLSLHEHDGSFAIRFNNQELMHSQAATSELLLGELALAHLPREAPARCLIGGLGLGFTVRAMLGAAGPKMKITVAELIPAVIEWNRTYLAGLNGSLLNDRRVEAKAVDVFDLIGQSAPGSWDAIALDIDNGPFALVKADNERLYRRRGLLALHAALAPKGRAAIWSAGPDPRFAADLGKAGFSVEVVPAKVRPGSRRAAYTIFVADKRPARS
jgi:spermidine synthase